MVSGDRAAQIGALAEALRVAGVAEADSSNRRRAEYSTDASNYRVVPEVVVCPRATEEVIAAVSVARRFGVSVTARGGGTSIAGNSVGGGVVLDLSRYLNRVLSVDSDARTAVAEPGTVLDSITAAAAPYGLRFGPDPSTHARATIGGSIGNNACGSRALRYGRTVDNVVELDVLTADGGQLTAKAFGRDMLSAAGSLGVPLQELVNDRLGLIRTEFGRFGRQVSGYSLEHLLPENGADLAKFLTGTEGTLGIVTRATVRLVKAPTAVALAVLGYPDMPGAAEAVPALLRHAPVALEGIDARLIDVVRSQRGPAVASDMPQGAGWLLVETAGISVAEAVDAARRLITDANCIDSIIVTGHQARELWRIREDGAGLGGRTPSGSPGWPGWEDAAVPPEHLPAYLREFKKLLTEHGLDGLIYGHFGDGCVHARIDFPLADRPERFRDFVENAAQLVSRYGGSLSGEHGDGRARSELLRHMYSPAALATFTDIKRIFDPDGIFNPGVVAAPASVTADLRLAAARSLTWPGTKLAFSYAHDGGDLSTAVHRCVGVGKCRADSTAANGVMCPSYLVTHDEKDSTRGRARVLQELANGSLVSDFGSREVHEALDLCLSCKGCAIDCPAGVDMSTYKAEVLHQTYRRRLRPGSHYALGWMPRWADAAALGPRTVNLVMRNPVVARAAKRLAGVDDRRPLPLFAPRTFRGWFRRRQPRPNGGQQPQVMLWVDTFTDHFSPEVGRAAVVVLEDAGYTVRIPARAVCCGLTWISTGQLDGAKRQLGRTLDALAPALTADIPIVGIEPSCTAVLRSDLAELIPGDPRSARVKALTRTLAEQLTATANWEPPDLSGITAVAQPHCHQHAVLGWAADQALLTAAGAEVTAIGGCCGLAGNFGFERGHYDVSVAVAETALLPAVRDMPHNIVLADGFSCRTQLAHLTSTAGQHLAQLLADRLPTTARGGAR